MKVRLGLSVRLALLYMTLFGGSVLVLGGVQYWVTVHAPMSAVKQRIEKEADALVAAWRSGGSTALAARLAQRAAANGSRLPYHALGAPDGSLVASNVGALPASTGRRWQRLDTDTFVDGEQLDHEALLLEVNLPDGARLLVGRDIEDIDEIEEKLLTAIVGVVGSTVVLGLAGGLLMSLVIGRRLAAVTRAARRVMDGDLAGRIPANGSRDEFDHLNATLNAMLARLEDSFESVRRVSDSVVHELRTPLARLRARLETLRETPGPVTPAAIDALHAEVENVEKIFDAVLRIARIEGHRQPVNSAAVDLSALLRDAADLYAPMAEERRQSLQLAIADQLVVPGDRELLFQAVCNLLDNAVKFTPEGGSIALAARRSGADIEVTVRDNGPGVEAEDRAHLVERFFRASSTADTPGLGLGLSLVSAVAGAHASTLTFEDAGPGLAVRWRLPARAVSAA